MMRLLAQRTASVGGSGPEHPVADVAYDEALVPIEHLNDPRTLAYVIGSWIVGYPRLGRTPPSVRLTPSFGRTTWRRWRAADRALREARVARVAVGAQR